ncbi:membrane-associated phosphatidylinositol transfer protein 2 isoform X1 [Desmodus rotundus]|uniref:membrane-associated phosphatidylinositol transfer protein 2 isoform X1 n=1 Tax=Desmodus rotundus TaxID=9430 RepID=UPI0023812AD6|nr:membrane-associated phosphatidylinositol transfer protein 2 isoform X1 [Desmodus rotundus]XP_053784659.1 membrane-associated phosphatidylinositol transfer protein 2 isoform X1 [Desmodus rotundus]XP_053784660.1 membrane-associated phosphatidylinositol transfer protein 2 isoform X1 [Desmodus rotundus]XP_053784661.1 membrane-associated phosphatidylinositol transfer protein 2 isoform X1 [Desmodus rotundus]XP_053784662.1 membrane-associated phosphatidylinositol transfer protein 2 isoform X1 [Desm
MIIKEYRIPLPMTVEEYRIAQLYMIQKKSRNETYGEGSGVEILENRPYTDGPGGSGQYTHKVYHVGMHIPSWFRSILPKAALRVVEESWNAYPYTRTRFTCPFVEKFSIDIETFYKTDAGENPNVFSLSPVEKNQLAIDFIDIVKDPVPPNEYRTEEDPKLFHSTKTQRGPLSDNWIEEYKQQVFPIMCAYKLCKVEFRYWGMQSKIERFIHDTGLRKVMVRAHRQAWCWQDEWYGLSMENIRELEKEAQLMLSRKMAQFSEDDEEASELAKGEAGQAQAPGESPQPSSGGEPLAGRGLKKQWSTSSKSSRSSKRGASPSRHSISEWRMQSIARDSDESSDDEFFDAHEDLSDSEEMFPKDITKWSSNDLMDKIEGPEPEDTQDGLYRQSTPEFRVASSVERLNIIEDEVSPPLATPPSKVHVLLLVLHGGTILDTGAGDPGSKQGDANTIATVFDTVMRVHYPSALGRLAIRLVPCPPVCSDAFALVSNLSPYSHDEGCLSSSQDHIPLAALPLLATSSPQYQEAVATVIQRANLTYGDFIKSQEGVTFNGQVCLIGDCVGGILAFDALCCSSQPVSESQSSSRRGSVASVQDADLLSPGALVNPSHGGGGGGGSLENSRHLSRSNIDIPRSNGTEDPKRQLPRKRSDTSTYELDTIQQHQAFLSSLHASVLRNEPCSRRSSSSTMLDGTGALGKFDFEIADLFLFGCPLGLVLALRKTVIPTLDVFQLRPACQQVYNLFHPADPSASRLEPLLERRFHALPPLSIPRYQRYPLGDGCSTLLVETVQRNPELVLEGGPLAPLPPGDGFLETSIPVPALTWQDGPSPGCAESEALQTHNTVFQEHTAPSSPGAAPATRGFRRASEISIASQVSGMAESYTASSIAQKAPSALSHTPSVRRLSLLALPSPPPFTPGPRPQARRVNPSLPDLDIGEVAAKWWGQKRIDYALYCPDALTAFPTVALPHLFHASYWESTDVVSFLLRQVMRHDSSSILELDGKEVSVFTPSKPREKWQRKRTHVKLRNVAANHRINDAVANEDGPQVLTGRFMYGPLDMVTLTGEKVDVHIMTQPPSGDWLYLDTLVTNSSGRVSYAIPETHRLGVGVYPVKMVVRGDHTFADSYITVLPKGTEFVVFSIDGSFAASVSIMGSDPKVRAGAVDVVRHWQDLGYLIIYVTGRPDMQKQRVVAWLAQHNFPHGVVSFCDGLVHDPLRHKANFLKLLISELHLRAHAAYGSTKDVAVYSSINLSPMQIYIVGRPTKKLQQQCQFITDGYAAHLAQLKYNHRARPARNTATRMALRKGSFGLPGQSDFLRSRNHLLRTISAQPSGPSLRHERTQSQPDGEQRGQRSMSVAAGCWGRTMAGRLEPGAATGPK